jgi:hypothetical protein
MSGLIRAKDIIVDDVLDKIYKAYIGHKTETLVLQDQWLLERMEYADAKIREGGEASRPKNLIPEMQQYFKHHAIGDANALSTRTIENDIARAKRFFLSARPREDKEYAKGKYIEWGEKMLAKYERENDNIAWNILYNTLCKVQGFDKEDIERPDYAAIQPAPIFVVSDPADIGVPVIDDLEGIMKILTMPKGAMPDTYAFDDAEVVGDDE